MQGTTLSSLLLIKVFSPPKRSVCWPEARRSRCSFCAPCLVHMPHHSLIQPLHITGTICPGYHVPMLLRHPAYDGSCSVTADGTFSTGAINKCTTATAGECLTKSKVSFYGCDVSHLAQVTSRLLVSTKSTGDNLPCLCSLLLSLAFFCPH